MFSSFASRLMPVAARLACDEGGADLIEYALVTALFALMGFLSFTTLGPKMGTGYKSFDNAAQGLWIPPAPAGAGS